MGDHDDMTEEFGECGDNFDNAEEVQGHDGEAVVCILQKLLYAPKQAQLPQRNAIFRTRCTIDSKVRNAVQRMWSPNL